MQIPDHFKSSKALQYIESKGFKWKVNDNTQIELEICPHCKKPNYGHFYMVVDGSNRDGVYSCHKCGKGGNLTTLRVFLDGSSATSYESRNEWANSQQKDNLPDVDAAHKALLADQEALDWLMNVRGYSFDVIKKQKLRTYLSASV